MQSTLLKTAEPSRELMSPVKSVVSFVPYINFLKKQLSVSNGMKAKFYRFIIRKFEQHPILLQPIDDLVMLGEYNDLLHLVDATIFPLVYEEENNLFALTPPMTFEMFYFSKGMYHTIVDKKTGFIKELHKSFSKENFKNRKENFLYNFILEYYYDIHYEFEHTMIYPLWDEQTRLMKYYNVKIDRRFIKLHLNGSLPVIDHQTLIELQGGVVDVNQLHKQIPLDLFSLEGFAILNVVDITAQQSIEQIKNTVLGINELNENEVFDYIKGSLKTLLQENDLEVGLLPFLKINNRFIIDDEISDRSILLKLGCDCGSDNNAYTQIAEEYEKDPVPVLLTTITEEVVRQKPEMKMLYQSGIKSYLVLPLYNNGKLLGVVELGSRRGGVINTPFISRLEPAKHLLSQVLQHTMDVFENKIERTIKEKFTSLQPSVEWKFNEVAWAYIQKSAGDAKADVDNVVFREVFPIYGAIDIRNSSIERNAAIQKDHLRQLEILQLTLKELRQHIEISLLDEMIFKSIKWHAAITEVLTAEDELKINDFFEKDVNPLLKHFKTNHSSVGNILLTYFEQSEIFKGVIHHNRDEYQESVDLVNNRLIKYMEKERRSLQKSYPNYFEKYKTDGIEYNIYIGQSIAPDNPFDLLYLKNLRLWQLSSMAAITRMTHELLPQMKIKLQTTQLILIHSNPIDISFRRDERRFDVEGSYNIRYEIMKKRIDKVHIQPTGERLTQPGKIALVYSNQKEVEEYIKFIEYLQDQQTLKDDIEYLELEEVQGLYGLRALRVGVQLD
ncbi:MAG: GAF domain-containing protein [Ferruginibacter sp.]|nr:GAF domain-containing protein [Ferruginibacter sp.]